MCKLDQNPIPRACLGDAEVLALDGGPFEREMDALCELIAEGHGKRRIWKGHVFINKRKLSFIK